MWDGFDKRKFPRMNLHCEIEIRSAEEKSEPITTVTENVGAGGVAVFVNKALDRFSSCNIRLDFDKQKKDGVQCSGKIVWIVPTRDSQNKKTRYDVGIEFVGMKPEDLERLRQHVEEFARNFPEERTR